MQVTHIETSEGKLTEVSYIHDGCRKAARLPGWLSAETARRSLIAFRNADRNKI